MLDKLEFIESKYEDLGEKISDPDVIGNQDEWRKFVKEHSHLEPIVNKYKEYKKVQSGIAESKDMLKDKLDKDFKDMVEMELEELSEKKTSLEEELRILMLPKDPNDDKGVMVEIRAGAGGSEAALFAGDLFRMYTRFAERNGWKYEIMSSSIPDMGGIKEIIFLIDADGAYSRLKYESGVHRVQRIPTTESGGRIHTSTATVAVLPEAEDVEIDINQNDLRVDVYRSSGNGGQSVNTTDSAVRITHVPTGQVVTCQDEKSQLKNKDKAMKILKTRLYEMEQEKQDAEMAQNRKSQVGTGDRSERIRTYNFPQGRITDHRIGMTVYKLEEFLDGSINEMIDALTTTDQAEKLKMQQ
ncbi:peptide chain release factor 1 [Alkalibacter saccharofermentans]|uniref:Peptide chain release factor 1 n=1 Tax=Alkalibacter saccharofermentans DSM 14828 TaxID=1120975 RepID=A0A1M4Y271_9FIRM|nr:peptide chain release factor 1 [Alkalibacter saccharofermentans]SHE99934.1 peptide chain release factor 1 [Alkalibacter saccharofermentans DSM 14828]